MVVGSQFALLVVPPAGEKQHPKRISIQFFRDFHNDLLSALKFLNSPTVAVATCDQM